MEQSPFLSKERRDKKGDKKGDKPRNQSRNQQETGNHDGTEQIPFLRKERGDKKGDKKADKKGDKPLNQSRNQEEPENHDGTKTVSSKNWEPIQLESCLGNNRKSGTKTTKAPRSPGSVIFSKECYGLGAPS